MDWTTQLVEQLDWHWEGQLRPRLIGLTDDEYFWEPAAPCWNVRPRGTSSAPVQAGSGAFTIDFAFPPPEPPPVTTIAWRLVHVGAGCLGNRASTFFGDGSVPAEADMFDPRHLPADLPGGAEEAVAFLDRSYRHWHHGIAGLDEEGLARPLGPRGGPFAEDPMAELIAHINREVMHHGAEIGLLRDLYRATGASRRDSRLVPRP
jgi:hypothetical protein